jgi:hypothetical protein
MFAFPTSGLDSDLNVTTLPFVRDLVKIHVSNSLLCALAMSPLQKRRIEWVLTISDVARDVT